MNNKTKNISAIHQSLRQHAKVIRELSPSVSLDLREKTLLKLKKSIQARERQILSALFADLGKPEFEAFANEYGFVLTELNHTLKEFRSWAQDVSCETPVALWPASSKIVFEPKGAILIIAPWNYPFQLSFGPLIAAIAAGNTVLLKPSEFAPSTAKVVDEIVAEVWPKGEVVVVNGDGDLAASLTDRRWDHVFFTGSTEVGRKVMTACAQYLTPVTLELGGKSPCIFGPFAANSKNFGVALRRLIWGKFMNAGQTCIAPDYVLVHESNRDRFLEEFPKIIQEFYGNDPTKSSSLSKIVSERHFDRLESLLSDCKILFGGKRERASKSFGPTLVEADPQTAKIWNEEIFGPVLPILCWKSEQDLDSIIEKNPRPLALYVLGENSTEGDRWLRRYSFGGGASGDTLVHVANPSLPFGGVGESGLGSYHGKWGFTTFSHTKSLVIKSYALDLKVRYPPYGDGWKKIKGFLS
jgi:aldehyde dehydrogenase (NAD+)